MKTHAFYKNSDGIFKRITARQVYLNRDLEPGKWRDVVFFPRREEIYPMHVSRRNNKQFFVFKSDQDRVEYENSGGGESKTHYLIKLAICELKSTTLKIKGYSKDNKTHEEKVYFKNAKDEYHRNINGKDYYIDVLCEFESESSLSLKWNRMLGIEVFHSNKVPDQKIRDLQNEKIPVVEFQIPEIKHYWGSEDDCDAQEERKYIEYVKKVLSGFMHVKVLSNPSSNAYLSEINNKLMEKINKFSIEIKNTRNDLIEVKNINNEIRATLIEKNQLIESLNRISIGHNTRIDELTAQLECLCDMNIFELIYRKIRNTHPFSVFNSN